MAAMEVTVSWATPAQDASLKGWRIYASLTESERGNLVATAEPSARSVTFQIEEGEYEFTVVPVSNADVEGDWQKRKSRLRYFVQGTSQDEISTPTTVAIQQVSPDGGARVEVDPLPADEDADRIQVIEGADAETGKLVAEFPVPRAGATEAHVPQNSPIIPLDGSEEDGGTRSLLVRSVTPAGKPSAVATKSVVLPERTQMEGVVIAAVSTSGGGSLTNFPTPTGSEFFTHVGADGFKTTRLPAGDDAAACALLGDCDAGARFTEMRLTPYPQFVKIESNEVDLGANVLFVLDCFDEVQRVTAVGDLPSRELYSLSLHTGVPVLDRAEVDANEMGPGWLTRFMTGEGKLKFPIRSVRWEYVIGTSSSVAHADGDYKPLVKGAWVKGRYVRVRLVIRDPIGWHQIKTGNIKVYARVPRVDRRGTVSPESLITAPPGSRYLDSAAGSIWVKSTGLGNTGWVLATSGGTPAAHRATHEHGGSDAMGSSSPAANVIVKAGAGGEIDEQFVPDFVGDSGSGGWKGAVPAPAAGDAAAGKFLKADGTWAAPAGGGSTASTTEVLTGTDNAKSVTPDALAALWEKGSDVASAGTISLGEGGLFHITGTTTITDIDFATDKAGRPAILKFGGSLSLTHSSTLICPESRDLQVHDGDVITVVSEGSDVVRVVNVERAQPILFKVLAADDTGGQNVNTAQPWFPTNGAVTVKANTTYRIRGILWLTRSAGSTGHTTGVLFGGTATLTSLLYEATCNFGNTPGLEARHGAMISVATIVVVKATSNSTTENICIRVLGTIRTNGAGTLIPQFQYSAAPGGAPTIKANSFFELRPDGAGGVTESGTWA